MVQALNEPCNALEWARTWDETILDSDPPCRRGASRPGPSRLKPGEYPRTAVGPFHSRLFIFCAACTTGFYIASWQFITPAHFGPNTEGFEHRVESWHSAVMTLIIHLQAAIEASRQGDLIGQPKRLMVAELPARQPGSVVFRWARLPSSAADLKREAAIARQPGLAPAADNALLPLSLEFQSVSDLPCRPAPTYPALQHVVAQARTVSAHVAGSLKQTLRQRN